MNEKEINNLKLQNEELKQRCNEMASQCNSIEVAFANSQKENERLMEIIENLSEGIARISRR